MAQVINTTFKLKRGTAARWAEVNPILAQGEPGFVYDANRLKIGDGITAWNDLPYIDGKRENAEIVFAIEAVVCPPFTICKSFILVINNPADVICVSISVAVAA